MKAARLKKNGRNRAGGMRSAAIFALATVMMMVVGAGEVEGCPVKVEERLQIEIFGGLSAFNPHDLNMFSRAEEQYNELYFIQRLRYIGGYFVNDLPEMKWARPFGFRIRYRLAPRFALSVGLEGFTERRRTSFEGTFGYDTDVVQLHTRGYDPYSLELWGWMLMGGIHYSISVGEKTDIEVGAAAGWSRASFNYSSTWTYGVEYRGLTNEFSSLDGGTLEGDGSGSGLSGQVMVRLSRILSRRVGFFVETAATYCRMNSIGGSGRETRMGIPGEVTWEGDWGIKKEDIKLSWAEDEVYVPSNYWDGWSAGQRDRDFVLNLSGIRFGFGIFLRL